MIFEHFKLILCTLKANFKCFSYFFPFLNDVTRNIFHDNIGFVKYLNLCHTETCNINKSFDLINKFVFFKQKMYLFKNKLVINKKNLESKVTDELLKSFIMYCYF